MARNFGLQPRYDITARKQKQAPVAEQEDISDGLALDILEGPAKLIGIVASTMTSLWQIVKSEQPRL